MIGLAIPRPSMLVNSFDMPLASIPPRALMVGGESFLFNAGAYPSMMNIPLMQFNKPNFVEPLNSQRHKYLVKKPTMLPANLGRMNSIMRVVKSKLL